MALNTEKLSRISSFDLTALKAVGIDAKEILETLGMSIVQVGNDEIICHCPFAENHKNGDKTPSFSFNTEKMVYNCFTCGGGTLISLIKYLRGLDDSQVEKWVLEHASSVSEDRDLRDEVNKRLIKEEDVATSFPQSILTSFNGFHPYLDQRGLSKEVCSKMRIGYDEAHSGITIPHFFNNKLVGWQTRHLIQDSNGKFLCQKCPDSRVPKYTNTHGFPKKNTLYNYSNALDNCRVTGEEIIVVESPMTALKLMTLGYNSVVATFGSWSKEQMFSLIGCLQGVILWPDSDKAGDANVRRVIPILTQFVPVKIAPILDKEKGDPGDLDKEEVAEYLKYCYSPFTVIVEKNLLNLKEAKMSFQKFGDKEKIVPLDNEEQLVIQSHVVKTGKAVQDFTDEERDSLHVDLDNTE